MYKRDPEAFHEAFGLAFKTLGENKCILLHLTFDSLRVGAYRVHLFGDADIVLFVLLD